MHSLALLAGLAALSTQVAASPVAAPGVRINQVSVGKQLKNGPLEVAKTYQKYKVAVPANVAAAAAAVQSGRVTATPESYDESYLCPVTVGTPGVTLNLDFDTGSSDLWVFSSLQASSQRTGHAYYTPSGSTTSSVETGETWDISYGDGSGAKGTVYADTVKIGGVTATSMAVEAATSVSSEFTTDTANDGLVGLAWPNINTCSPNLCTPFMQQVDSTFPSKLFTADLKAGKPGSYDFGFINATKYTGSITYTAVNTANGFWEFTASGYHVGTTAYTLSMDSIVDTGTTLLYLPDSVLTKYYAQVSGAKNSATAGGYVFPCASTLPSLSITISGVSHTIPGTYLNYAPYSGTTCFGGLQSSDGIGFNILGDVFIKSQFIIFDVGNTRLGVATASGS